MPHRTLASLLVYSLLLACSDSKAPTAPDIGVTGTWHLQTVDGQALPFTLPEDDGLKADLTAEVITLTAPNTVTLMTTFLFNDHGRIFTESAPDSGTYTVDGSTVTVVWKSDGSITPATVNGDTMSLFDPGNGFTFVYRRE